MYPLHCSSTSSVTGILPVQCIRGRVSVSSHTSLNLPGSHSGIRCSLTVTSLRSKVLTRYLLLRANSLLLVVLLISILLATYVVPYPPPPSYGCVAYRGGPALGHQPRRVSD